jgi:cytochrome c oxidase subunit 2
MFGLATLVFLLVLFTLLYALYRRRGADGVAEPTPVHSTRWIVAGGVALPVVVLIFLFILTLRTMAAFAATQPGLTVEVIGHEWWWEVRYPDQRITTANEIHIPAGQPVLFKVTSADVNHSLWVPQLHGKIDLIAGQINSIMIQADRPGTYRGQCAEYCGMEHALMAFLVIADSPAQWTAWVDQQRQPLPAATDERTVKAEQVFATKCAQCYALQGTGATSDVGPDLTHLASRRTLAAGVLQNTPDNLANWIITPRSFKPGAKMPPIQLDKASLQAIVAYLERLK